MLIDGLKAPVRPAMAACPGRDPVPDAQFLREARQSLRSGATGGVRYSGAFQLPDDFAP